LLWHAFWVEPQANRQAVPAVEFRLGAGALLGLGGVVGTTGSTQLVRQFAAVELHDIMQVVVVKVRGVGNPGVGLTTFGVVVCATAGPDTAAAARAKITTKTFMTIPLTMTDANIAPWGESCQRSGREQGA
jgi:hypothetical protein